MTEIQGTVNARYDAVAIGQPGVGVLNAEPINRIFAPADIDHTPREVGDVCLLYQDETGDFVLDLFERIAVIDCEDAGTNASDLFAFAYTGV